MNNQHKWEKINRGWQCKFCDLKKKTIPFGYSRQAEYIDGNGSVRLHAGKCKRNHKESKMKILDIIDKARAGGIMPDLKHGVYLAFAKDGIVRMYNREGRYRQLFKIDEISINLAPSLLKYFLQEINVSENNSYIDFIETQKVKRVRTISNKVGEDVRQVPHEVTYINIFGDEITIEETISKVFSVFKVDMIEEEIDRFVFID